MGGDIVSCEMDWYNKRYPSGKIGNRSSVLCADSSETGCTVWLGDPDGTTSIVCPPLGGVFKDETHRMQCNWEFGPLWPFTSSSKFPTLSTQLNATQMITNASTAYPAASEVIPFEQPSIENPP